MKRGDIVRVELPRPRGQSGREQFGLRPAIVVQSDNIQYLSTVMVVPMTSRASALQFAGAFPVAPTAANGLDVESFALTHQLRAIDRNRIEAVIGTLGGSDLATLEVELRKLLDL